MLSKPIIINSWDGGISDSIYKGISGSHAFMIGCDIQSEPGILQIANRMDSEKIVGGLIKGFVESSVNLVFAIGGLNESPCIYKTTDAGDNWARVWVDIPLSPGEGQGSLYWRNYILLAGNNKLDVFHPGNDSATVGWKDITNDEDWHPMKMGERDGAAYIACGRYIALLTEVAGQVFNPNDSATYSWNATALDIPSDFRIRSIEEVGNYLLLGCWRVSDDSSYPYTPVAIIYPWDYILRPASHEGPISLRRMKGVSAMLNVNNVLYAWVGTRGELFYYNGSKLVKMEKFWKHSGSMTSEIYPEAVKSNYRDTVLFGVSNQSGHGDGGIYTYGAYDERKYNSVVNLEFPISQGQDLDYEITALHIGGTTDDKVMAAWSATDKSTYYGIDRINTTRLYGSARFESRLIRVATSRNKAIIDGFEIILDSALSNLQVVTLKYRKSTSDNWTTVSTTLSNAHDHNKTSKYIEHKINDVVNLQVRVDFAVAGTASEDSIKLKEIRIK